MVREDARIASVLRAVGLPVRRTTWRIRPNGARSEVVEHVAACMGLGIEGQDDNTLRCGSKGRFPWDQHLRLALKSLQYGHACFERSYVYESGRFWLRMGPRPQSSIAYWNVDRDGGLISIQQYPAGTFGGPGMVVLGPTAMGDPIPADRWWSTATTWTGAVDWQQPAATRVQALAAQDELMRIGPPRSAVTASASRG